jgi:hypothetical protein
MSPPAAAPASADARSTASTADAAIPLPPSLVELELESPETMMGKGTAAAEKV